MVTLRNGLGVFLG